MTQKFRYYYNGNLLRTSAHDYKFACINKESGKAWSVNSTRALAEKTKNDKIRELQNNIDVLRKDIEDIKNGITHRWVKVNGRSFKREYANDWYYGNSIEKRQEEIDSYIENLRYCEENLIIVEVEKR